MKPMKNLLAATPPMGWMSWNLLGKDVNEHIIKETADAMVQSGMQALGYEYVCIDNHWPGGRDESGALYPSPEKFPNGIAALADYIHARGLKLGIYSDAGVKTCGGCPGSEGYEEIDARTFAAWGVDYLKYDWCNTADTRENAERLYSKMGAALRATGRPIVFAICEWGHHRPWVWGPKVGGQLWRTFGDIWDAWGDGSESWQSGIDTIAFEMQRGLEAYAGPGHWNDPDMLIIGLRGKGFAQGGGCTDTEYRTQMSAWCMLAAPLMASCDLRSMDTATRDILMNPEMIAVNQDPLGKQGYRVYRSGKTEVWKKSLQNGELAVAMFNRDETARMVNVPWSDIEISGRYHARDLWALADLGILESMYSQEVEGHGSVVLRLAPELG